MRVVIGGAGEVGRNITEALRIEDHAVVLIDKDPQACEDASHLDCMIIQGHAASTDVLDEAGIAEADVFYAVTSHDEVNLSAAAVAKSQGAEHVFARVNSAELMDEPESRGFSAIGIDVAVSPDFVAAEKIRRIIEFPGVLEIDAFEAENLRVVETRVEPGSPAAGQPVRDLDLPEGVNLVAIFRGAEVHIPRGDDVLQRGDRGVIVLGGTDLMPDVNAVFGDRSSRQHERGAVRHVVVAGGTPLARRIARRLDTSGRRVTMIAEAESHDDIEELAADMPDTLVLEGSSRDVRVFHEEGLDEADAIVAASGSEEYNLITCLLASSIGVPRTMALVGQPELEELAERLGVDAAISPRLTAVSTLLKHTSELGPDELTLLQGGDAQVLVVEVTDEAPLAGRSLREAKFPRGTVVGAVVREGETIVPRGDETIRAGDKVVIFATTTAVSQLSDLL